MYNVGDRVVIIDDLLDHDYPGSPGVTDEMTTLSRQTFTIGRIFKDYGYSVYRLKEDLKQWNWDERWLIPADETKINIEESEFKGLFNEC